MIKKIYICIIVCLILIRHGISPFHPLKTQVEKISRRLTDSEKQYIIRNAPTEMAADYYKKNFYL